MSIFDDVVSKVTGGTTAGGGGQGLVTSVLEMLSNRQGGISGLAETFQQNGLGQIVSSWIGTGGNLPVSADQIQQVFGSEQIQAFAQKAGIAPEAASSQLAELLPGVVDRLTPAGKVPQGGDLMSTGMGLLQGFFRAVSPLPRRIRIRYATSGLGAGRYLGSAPARETRLRNGFWR